MSLARIGTLLTALAVFAPLVAGCETGESTSQRQRGSLEILGRVSSALDQASISRVRLDVTRYQPSLYQATTDLTLSNGAWVGTISNLPPGDYIVDASAFDSNGSQLYVAQTTVNVQVGPPTFLSLNFHTTTPPIPNVNHAPFIDSISATDRNVDPGQLVTITASASDADNDPITYHWDATTGAITNDPDAASIIWQAPTTPGSYTLRVTANDGRGGVSSADITIVVALPPQTGSLAVTANFFDPPEISRMDVSNGQPQFGESVTLFVTYTNGTPQCVTPFDPACDLSFVHRELVTDCGNAVLPPFISLVPGLTTEQLQIPVTTSAATCFVTFRIYDAYHSMSTGNLTLHPGQPIQQ